MSDVTINVTVTQGGTLDADLTSATTVNAVVEEQTAVLEAEVVGGGKGEKGDTGDAATIEVGTVTTVGPGDPATVTNSGDEHAAVFDFDIPQGETGETGPGVPDGGTIGQVLVKLSGADQDTDWHTLVKADVGLPNVDNTSDANKPISTATQTALDAKQPLDADLTAIAALDSSTSGMIASEGSGWVKRTYAQIKTLLALVKADVGLGNVDNTSDANKPISTATQTALDAKQDLDADLTAIAGLDSSTAGAIASDGSGWIKKTYAQFKTALSLVKGDVGLGNVDNVQQQPLDSDLTAIAGLTPSNDDIIQRKAGAWTNRTMVQLISDLGALGTTFQPLDADLTTIAGLTATTDNFIQSKGSAWSSRTPTQVTADLIAFEGDSGSGGSKGLVPAPTTGDGTKFLKGDGTWATIPGGGDALTSNPLSQFASTTSLQLKGVMSDETGSGALVFGTGPVLDGATITTGLTPTTDDGAALGTTLLKFSDLFLASGSVINWNNGDLTLTHSSNTLTLAGGSLDMNGNNINSANAFQVANGGALRTATGAGNTLLLRAYDVDGAAYTTFATLTANNTPTMDLDDAVTKAGNYIYRGGGTDVPVADGGTGASTLTGILRGNGTSAIDGVDAGILSAIRVYTADDTWSKPAGLRFVVVEMVGGGGAGGGRTTTGASQHGPGGGGGAGEYAMKKIAAGSLGSTETIDVGAAGTGVSGAAGNNGSASNFGSHFQAAGGMGGGVRAATGNLGQGAAGGAGGTGGTGTADLRFPGGNGRYSITFNDLRGLGGDGGDSAFGSGGKGNQNTSTSSGGVGDAGAGYGAGGGGSHNSASTSAGVGGAGTAGVIIVREYM